MTGPTYEEWLADSMTIAKVYAETHHDADGQPISYAPTDLAHMLWRRGFERPIFPTLDAALADWTGMPVPPRPPSPSPLQRVSSRGPLFVTDESRPWRWKFVDAFRAFERWDRGDDLQTLFAWGRSVGANGLRVFLQYWWIGDQGTHPLTLRSSTPARVRDFVAYCNSHGWYVELTVLADCQFEQLQTATAQAQRARIAGVVDAVADLFVFIEMMNEPFKNSHGTDVWRDIAVPLGYDRQRPALMALGTYPDTGAEPDFKRLDYIGDHPPRKPDWPTECGKVGKYVYAQTGVRHLYDEPIGCAEQASGSRDPNPDNWEDAGGGIALSSAGGTFHFDAGIQALPPIEGSAQDRCARRYFSAMDRFPIDAPTGLYSHDGLSDFPLQATTLAGEVVGRRLGTTWYIQCAQPRTGWRPDPKPGHEIVRVLNARGTALEVAA